MVPINNSDTAWLIVSDYNQDNGKFYEELREDVYCPSINGWQWENFDGSVVGVGLYDVGGVSASSGDVGQRTIAERAFGTVGSMLIHHLVGGWS
jgi:hypothetical protein